jgi:hypothetical protein
MMTVDVPFGKLTIQEATMAISLTNTSADGATQAVQQLKKNTQTQQLLATQTTTETNNARQAQHHTKVAQQQAQAQKVAAPPKPVPNSQGQTTGKIVNVTA